MSGKREKKWGSEHHFREGQQKQRLDDLFMHFIEVGQRLQPKVIVAENVKGLILGNAKGYVKEIFAAFREAGYETQLFLFNAARMGVPQARERTFFIARRRDLGWGKLEMKFEESTVTAGQAIKGIVQASKPLTKAQYQLWEKCAVGKSFSTVHPKGSWFNSIKLDPNMPSPTVISSMDGGSASGFYHWSKPQRIYSKELARLQTFPDDYNSLSASIGYVCGMSVPPFMTQRVALEISRQWFGVEYS